jgi:REP element-mobilizing transposase RayT
MARKLRLEYGGVVYLVLSRGGRREAFGEGDRDRDRFLETVAEASWKTGWQIHAYCLVQNHFHLVVETQ